MQDAKRRKFDAILCWKLDCIGRSLKHLVNRRAVLEALGVALISFSDSLDLSTTQGRLMFQNNQFLLAASTRDGHKNVGFFQLRSSHLIRLGLPAHSLILGPDNAFLVSKANDLGLGSLVVERDFLVRIVGRIGNCIESSSA